MKSKEVVQNIKTILTTASDTQLAEYKKHNSICLIEISHGGEKKFFLLNLKDKLCIEEVPEDKVSEIKNDAKICMKDEDFYALAGGHLSGQKAFMTGKMKIKGNLMMVTRLENFLKSSMKAKL